LHVVGLSTHLYQKMRYVALAFDKLQIQDDISEGLIIHSI
jgi:hypothetical protein